MDILLKQVAKNWCTNMAARGLHDLVLQTETFFGNAIAYTLDDSIAVCLLFFQA